MSEGASSHGDTSNASKLRSMRYGGVEKEEEDDNGKPKPGAAVMLPRQASSGSDVVDSLPASPRVDRRKRRKHLMPVGTIEMPERRPSIISAPSIDLADYMLSPLPDHLAAVGSFHPLGHLVKTQPQLSRPQLSRAPSITVTDFHPAAPSASERGSQKLLELYENITIAIHSKPKPKAQPRQYDGLPQQFHGPPLQLQELATQTTPSSMDQLWSELQAYLCERTIEKQYQLLHSSREEIEQILLEVMQFELEKPSDEEEEYSQRSLGVQYVSLKSVKEEESDVGTARGAVEKKSEGEVDQGFQEEGEKRQVTGGGAERESEKLLSSSRHTIARSVSEPLPLRKKATDNAQLLPPLTPGDFSSLKPGHFLNQRQLEAGRKVHSLLQQLEEAESFYPSYKKMGYAHSQYCTLGFRRKVDALTLWLKLTRGLAMALYRMSLWLGVPVTIPQLCSSMRPPHPRTMRRISSNYRNISLDGILQGPYKDFVRHGLKRKSLHDLITSLQDFIRPILKIVEEASPPATETTPPTTEATPTATEETDDASMELAGRVCSTWPNAVDKDRTSSAHPTSDSASDPITTLEWAEEFESMNLPMFSNQYIELVHVPLDVMHECLKLRQVQHASPSESITTTADYTKQLTYECRSTLEEAVQLEQYYKRNIDVLFRSDPSRRQGVKEDLEFFQEDLKRVLQVYFDYLQRWVQVSSGCMLEEEWRSIKETCSFIQRGEETAGKKFCHLAAVVLTSIGNDLDCRVKKLCQPSSSHSYPKLRKAVALHELCYNFKELFVQERGKVSKAVGFTKLLIKNLGFAADFSVVDTKKLMFALAPHFVQVQLPNGCDKFIFIPKYTTENQQFSRDVHRLLTTCFSCSDFLNPASSTAYSSPEQYTGTYVVLVAVDPSQSLVAWYGETVQMECSEDAALDISGIEVKELKLVAGDDLSHACEAFLHHVGVQGAVTLTKERTSLRKKVEESIDEAKVEACVLVKKLMTAAQSVRDNLEQHMPPPHDPSWTQDLRARYQSTMHSCFYLCFEYIFEVFRLVGREMAYSHLGEDILKYAQTWMKFVLDRCEKVTGKRPTWATMGLNFLPIVCDPQNLANIPSLEFNTVRNLVYRTIDHIVGSEANAEMEKGKGADDKSVPGNNGGEDKSRVYLSPERTVRQRQQLHSPRHCGEDMFLPSATEDVSVCEETFVHAGSKLQKMYSGAKKVDEKLMKQRTVGKVVPVSEPSYERQSSLFKWQKTKEIGRVGKIGKMYECQNLETGERMVVKEVSIQERDYYRVQKAIIERTDLLKKLNHPNVLKFYGVEFHKTEVCIFMEYCSGTSLKEFAAQGLTEEMVRHYTRDLLKAVDTLHSQNIVHRNIKGSNIFLSSNGSIKLGDFGMVAELRGNLNKRTMKERISGICFLSPEVVLGQRFDKPMDIWSVGCVVVEMATGKEPWSGLGNEDIIVKLSSGESPTVQSKVLGKEGQDFLETHCFITDPEKRATAVQLLKHSFIKDYMIDENDLDLECGTYLGGGTSGDVYSGKWLSRKIEVAVKKVRCEPSESDVKILSSLSPHPNIIAFFGYVRTSLYTNIVTELAKNGSLYDRLHPKQEDKDKGKQVEKPTQEKCLVWAKEIAQGMVYLHRLEIIHRDLKSGNVLLADDDTAKLCDFGTARYVPRQDLGEEKQGTYRWMAPEVIDGGSADKHSDVYSFSMVMWELMAHKIPFHDNENELDAALLALEEHRPQLDDGWPEYITVLIKKCWTHIPYFRPSFDDIVTALLHKSCME